MLSKNQTYEIIYKKQSSYSELSNFQVSNDIPVINLTDYWDYLEGMKKEIINSRNVGVLPPLRRFSIFITNTCNLKCTHCTVSQKKSRSIHINWIKKKLVEAHELGNIFFDVMGLGEPTMVNDLPEILKYSTKIGMVNTLGTNGATPNLQSQDYIDNLIDAAPIKIRISLDSSDPKKHNSLRKGSEVWEKAVRFIEYLEKKRKENQKLIGIFINRIVTNNNYLDIPQDLKFFAKLGVDDVHLIPIRYQKDSFCSIREIKQYNEEITPEIEKISKKYCMPWLKQNKFIFGNDEESITRSSNGLYYFKPVLEDCHIMKSQIVFDQDLNIYTCLWGKRAGGQMILNLRQKNITLWKIREQLKNINYCSINPKICTHYCTDHIIQNNDLIQKEVNK